MIGLGIWLSRRKDTTINVAFLWFGATVIIDGLFALIGQIYQTGVAPRQLFALWTLLQLPLCFALRNVANLLLLCVTTNLAFFIYFNADFRSYQATQFTFFLNVLLFTLTCRFSSRFYDPWQIVCRTIAIIGILCGLYSGLLKHYNWLPVLCILAAGFWFFSSHREFKLPSHEFFFSEGKGEHYAQAEYGEYRFKQGKLLLSRLLDAKHQLL
ncbi:MAG: DUF2157 domain-containing protein [Pasteurellaceae bacterium]|nr:DUF2157 domain-containing protein [Pasteurellaceae bacterium]